MKPSPSVCAAERDVILQVMVPQALKTEIAVRAAAEGETQRTLVLKGLRAFRTELCGLAVPLRSDCWTVVCNLQRARVGSPRLLAVTRKIFEILEADNNIRLIPSHIPGVKNVRADKLSRIERWYGTVLKKTVFSKIAASFGGFDVDAMATVDNKQCDRFVSLLPHPAAEAIDFFRWTPRTTAPTCRMNSGR